MDEAFVLGIVIAIMTEYIRMDPFILADDGRYPCSRMPDQKQAPNECIKIDGMSRPPANPSI